MPATAGFAVKREHNGVASDYLHTRLGPFGPRHLVVHGARSSREHAFAAEAPALLESLPNVHAHVSYSRPVVLDL